MLVESKTQVMKTVPCGLERSIVHLVCDEVPPSSVSLPPPTSRSGHLVNSRGFLKYHLLGGMTCLCWHSLLVFFFACCFTWASRLLHTETPPHAHYPAHTALRLSAALFLSDASKSILCVSCHGHSLAEQLSVYNFRINFATV